MTFGSLFAGIGGFDLGLERAGMECRWQVEVDPFCLEVLAKHWPYVIRHNDVRSFPYLGVSEQWRVDVICGGFPCQDISIAGKGAGINGSKSGLWYEYSRIIRILRPGYVLIENVSALLIRGMDQVLCDLATIGYDAEWQVIPASAFGAPHQRDRIFIVAYPSGKRCEKNDVFARPITQSLGEKHQARIQNWPGIARPGDACEDRVRWIPNRSICRVVDGVPDRLDRYRALGNAVVPHVAEWIGRLLFDHHTNGG